MSSSCCSLRSLPTQASTSLKQRRTRRARSTAAASTLHSTINVELGERSYPIYVGRGLLHDAETFARHVSGDSTLIVTNDTVGPLYLDALSASLRSDGQPCSSVAFKDGERYKTIESVGEAWTEALRLRLGRDATFVALGGGVVGDMCGFAAATYQRGVDFVQVPTTLMAMVDSSVGGKTGVNHPSGKNMIGAFYQPQAVIIDTDVLQTLPRRELASGVAEAVKYGLIWDPALFEWLEQNIDRIMDRDPEALAHVVTRSCEIKAQIVAADEREQDLRATLNLGHTFGHAVETGMGYGVWLHGEAVSAGMCMAARMSADMGWCPESVYERTVALLTRVGTPTDVTATSMTPATFMEHMAVDKKNKGGRIRLILLKGELGNCVFTGDYDDAALDAVLRKYCICEEAQKKNGDYFEEGQ